MGGRRDRGHAGGGRGDIEGRGRGRGPGADRRAGGGGERERLDAGGERPRGRGDEDEMGYRQRVNERLDRLAGRVERLEEEVRQLRGGEGGSRRA
jgi:hypothetical protein